MEYLQYNGWNLETRNWKKIVLNLVISGIPSILINVDGVDLQEDEVLNLVISGIPSILWKNDRTIF